MPLISSSIPAITIVSARLCTCAYRCITSVYELRMRIPMHQTSGFNSIPIGEISKGYAVDLYRLRRTIDHNSSTSLLILATKDQNLPVYKWHLVGKTDRKESRSLSRKSPVLCAMITSKIQRSCHVFITTASSVFRIF